ncbi:hypothetical protein EDB19DRAFT_1952782 [Suillus lakei]|nr:hypothetical protein EDB19DRAFT_1952782 [Suillus lakei]
MSGQYPRGSFRLLVLRNLLRRLLATKNILWILLFNVRFLPFAWHIRVFQPLLESCDNVFSRTSQRVQAQNVRAKILHHWSEALCLIGAYPFELLWTTPITLDTSATPRSMIDSWPKNGSGSLSSIRKEWWVDRSGLYEMRLFIGAWDHKWIYMIARYASFPKWRRSDGHTDCYIKSRSGRQLDGHGAKPSKTPTASNDLSRMLRTPTEDLVDPPTLGDANEEDSDLEAEKIVQSDMTEPDGAVLHCVATTVDTQFGKGWNRQDLSG